MTFKRLHHAILMAAVAQLHCGETPRRYGLEQAVRDAARQSCDKLERCRNAWGAVYREQLTCMALSTTWLEPLIGRYEAALYDVDRKELEDCMADLMAGGCEHQFAPVDVAECIESSLVGRLGASECCDARGGCAPDSSCVLGSSGLGVCIPDVSEGEPCRKASCVAGLFCAADTTTCEAPGALGASCAGGVPCDEALVCEPQLEQCREPGQIDAPCLVDAHCVESLYCSASGSCVAYGSLNEPCDPLAPCAADLYCDIDTCAEPHSKDEPCVPDGCAEGLFCDLGLCASLPTEGESCFASLTCADGFVCAAIGLVCEPDLGRPPLVGEPCSYAGECPDGAECIVSQDRGTCVPRGLEGEACDAAGVSAPRCAPYYDLVCRDGRCTAAPALGERCQDGERCRSFLTTYCDQDAGVCRRRVPPWEACTAQPGGPDHDPCSLGASCDGVLELCVPEGDTRQGGLICPAG